MLQIQIEKDLRSPTDYYEKDEISKMRLRSFWRSFYFRGRFWIARFLRTVIFSYQFLFYGQHSSGWVFLHPTKRDHSIKATAVKASIMITEQNRTNFHAIEIFCDLTTGLWRDIKIGTSDINDFGNRYTLVSRAVLFFNFILRDGQKRNKYSLRLVKPLNYVTAFSHYARTTPALDR